MVRDECPHCGGPMLRTKRFGVWMTHKKARIFDLIQRAGSGGLPSSEICSILAINPRCLQAHITQINELLEDTGLRITYSRALWAWRVAAQTSRRAA